MVTSENVNTSHIPFIDESQPDETEVLSSNFCVFRALTKDLKKILRLILIVIGTQLHVSFLRRKKAEILFVEE